VKTIQRKNFSDYIYEVERGGIFIPDSNLSNGFSHQQMIYSYYLSFSAKIKKWSFRIGSRLERMEENAHFNNKASEIDNIQTNIIPTLSISKLLGKGKNFNISYSQRFERPGISLLNPFVNNTDPYNLYFGNPTLSPTLSHIIVSNFQMYAGKFQLSSSLRHQFTNNSILRFTVIGSDTIARTTYGNIGTESSSTGNLNVNFNSGTINFGLSANGGLLNFNSSINNKIVSIKGWNYNANQYGGISLDKWRFSYNVGFNSAKAFNQGMVSGFWNHSLNLSKSFTKKNQITITAAATNPFEPVRRNIRTSDMETFFQQREWFVNIERYSININFWIGKLQSIKQKTRSISNDDIKSGVD
jgi:hypothetical protein